MITIQQLNCFLAVAQHLSFVRASEELYISQPAVSRHINMLEQELGTTLFRRSRHSVTLTDAGERFYLEVMDVKKQLNMAIDTIRGSKELPEFLHIGFENTVEIHKLPEIIAAYMLQRPNVRFTCHGVDLSEATKMFNSNRLDILFTTCDTLGTSDEQFHPLFRGHFCCLMRQDDPLASRDLVHPDELGERSLIFAEKHSCAPLMTSLQREFHMKHPSIHIHFSTSAHYSIPMIEAGLGVVIMPDFLFSPHHMLSGKIVSIPLDIDATVPLGIMIHKNYVPDKVSLFVDLTKKCYSDETGCEEIKDRKRKLLRG